ncbi:AAC-rich mRNA clone AAC11 protein-like, partial [Eurosta solidaginis]|uniref:AAC-rich mRNA clone AAC11 protein-like n=1 Tax=Eurosta solidaginis TaxID=178769 RepID=UPI00353100C4
MPYTTTTMTTATTNILPPAAGDTNNNSNVGIRSSNNTNNNNNHSTNNSSITNSNSPKCALRRSELITKNKVLNNKFMLRRLTNRQDSMNSISSGQSCGSSGSTSSDELLLCNSKTMLSNDGGGAGVLFETFKMSPAGSRNSVSTSPALPLFCMGNTFPHIDRGEENADERRSDAHGE